MAAGKGTRMNSDLPKVLHRLCGKPLIAHVLKTAFELRPDRVLVIVGHRREEVIKELRDRRVEWVVQEPQLGTGHAVQQAAAELDGFHGDVIVLSGDVPMLKSATLSRLQEQHEASGAAVTVLSAKAENPTAYGRIIRDSQGRFQRIVEEREATDEERKIHEINSGIYCFDSDSLFSALSMLKANNTKGEYYLTDVVGILNNGGKCVQAVEYAEFYEVQGINTQAELASMEATFARK
ncbi:UDP-N-acetylglucosamine pyrophosphorylase [candidate division KSB1 bacterium]|nr:MAG: UDP-N-acetylglucosamine pyrophosphorylase [candidate division KSB1 bacterium]